MPNLLRWLARSQGLTAILAALSAPRAPHLIILTWSRRMLSHCQAGGVGSEGHPISLTQGVWPGRTITGHLGPQTTFLACTSLQANGSPRSRSREEENWSVSQTRDYLQHGLIKTTWISFLTFHTEKE